MAGWGGYAVSPEQTLTPEPHQSFRPTPPIFLFLFLVSQLTQSTGREHGLSTYRQLLRGTEVGT